MYSDHRRKEGSKQRKGCVRLYENLQYEWTLFIYSGDYKRQH